MDGFPACQVCNEHFTLKGPVPNLLPCLHAVCDTCVTSTAGEVISCSTCQRAVNLTEEHLQKDMVRQREIYHLTVQHRPSELLCTHEDDGNQAVCWCQECEDFLCEYCQTLHESFKATRKHAVQEITDIQPERLDHEEYCSTHKTYPLDMWDRNCGALICARCRRTDHAEDDVEDIDVAADSTKAEMAAQEREIERVSEDHRSFLDALTEQNQSMCETSVTLSEKITHTFQSLKSLMDQREKELLAVLQQRTDQTKSHLASKTLSAQSNQRRCQVTKDYINKAIQYSSKYDILRLKKSITESSQTCLDSAQPEEQEDFPLPEFYTDGLDNIKETLSCFGDLATSKYKASQRNLTEDKTTQTGVVSLEDLEYIQKQHKEILQGLQIELMTSASTIKHLETTVSALTEQKIQSDHDIKHLQRQLKKSETEVSHLHVSVRKLTSEKHDTEKHGVAMSSFLEMQLNQQGMYLLKSDSMDKSFLLKCLHLKYDTEKVNLKRTHINNAGELVNKPDPRACGDTSGRFQNYWGTTCIAPLPLTDSPQYEEVLSSVGITKPPGGRTLILETGICRRDVRDVTHQIPLRQYCYRLSVFGCHQHNSTCTCVWKDDEMVHHLPDTLPNTAGSHITLHHGVVFETAKNRIVFFDVNQMKVIGALDNVDYTQPMWPMFGVFAPSNARISMKLVAGNDIDMTPEKKAMILKAL